MSDQDIIELDCDELEEYEDIPDEFINISDRQAARHQKLQVKNKGAITRFLGKGARSIQALVVPGYYGRLLTWALNRMLESEGWETVKTFGYHTSQPIFIDVGTDYQKTENLLQDGQMLVKKGELRFIITVNCANATSNSALIESEKANEKMIQEFAEAIRKCADEHNFYRGKRLEFSGFLELLNIEPKPWDSIILNEEIKAEIRANTVDFLRRCQRLEKYGIPPRRGIVLAGEPGTGKTIVCRALMSEAEGITCITANAYLINEPFYVSQLYELASDLDNCIVFIEDIDLIGQERFGPGYRSNPSLSALLNEMDGIEKQKQIVTVATTNGLETLDKALCERPSRFDRVIKLNRPTKPERAQIIDRLCEKIPLGDIIQDYIARRSDGFSPAQLQEVIFGLVIDCEGIDGKTLDMVSQLDVDRNIGRINGRRCYRLGFNSASSLENAMGFGEGSQNKTHQT